MKDILKVLVFGGLFLIPFLTVYVETDFFFPYITGKNFAFRIIVEIVFASWILLALSDVKYRPRFSWILAGFASLLAVMLAANILGEYAPKSFWSNFERMDGYVTLIHLFMYIVVAGSVITTQKLWSYFFHVSSAVALFVAVYGLAQVGGLIDGGRVRVDAQLGNAAYMAVYMLFHIFIVMWLFTRSNNNLHRALYAVAIAIFAYTLLLTGTRGTFLGFVGGFSVAIGYIALFGRRYPELRSVAIGGCVVAVIGILGFIALKDTDFIQNNAALKRIATIDIQKDLETRAVIWSIAMKGVEERPILGWGQGNFSYVFNEHFDPVLYNKEAWFDRTHNIFLDWLIAGGVLGLLAYLSITIAALYYLFYLPLVKKDETFDALERAVLLGLIAGYFMHNLVVFDNIISYIYFGSILAYIHSRVSQPIEAIESVQVSEKMTMQFFAPIVILLTGATVYFVNVPGIGAASDIIDAMQESTVKGRLEQMHSALERNSFADQEIVEQLVQQAMNVGSNDKLPENERAMMIQRAELELLALIEEKPNDARLHNFLATFYRSIRAFPQAQEQAAIARSLAPKKQAIIIEQAIIELQMNNVQAGSDFLKEAYELETSNAQALVLYAATLFQLDRAQEAKELIGEEFLDEFASNDYAVTIVLNDEDEQEFLKTIFEKRIEQEPKDPQHRVSLAFLYYKENNLEKTIEILEEAADAIPGFNSQAQCFIENINAGVAPSEGC